MQKLTIELCKRNAGKNNGTPPATYRNWDAKRTKAHTWEEEEEKNKRKIVSQSIGRLCIDSLFILIEIDLVLAIIIYRKYKSIATATE